MRFVALLSNFALAVALAATAESESTQAMFDWKRQEDLLGTTVDGNMTLNDCDASNLGV